MENNTILSKGKIINKSEGVCVSLKKHFKTIVEVESVRFMSNDKKVSIKRGYAVYWERPAFKPRKNWIEYGIVNNIYIGDKNEIVLDVRTRWIDSEIYKYPIYDWIDESKLLRCSKYYTAYMGIKEIHHVTRKLVTEKDKEKIKFIVNEYLYEDFAKTLVI